MHANSERMSGPESTSHDAHATACKAGEQVFAPAIPAHMTLLEPNCEKQASKFYWELVSGIEYLHKSGVCHRDLKPENLLLDYDNTLKIVDFGLSNMYEKNETLKTACGSPCYAAPEVRNSYFTANS